jgi:hypothetical protein
MTTTQKIIHPKMGLLKLAEKLGNISEACKVMGYAEIAFTAFKSSMRRAGKWRSKK